VTAPACVVQLAGHCPVGVAHDPRAIALFRIRPPLLSLRHISNREDHNRRWHLGWTARRRVGTGSPRRVASGGSRTPQRQSRETRIPMHTREKHGVAGSTRGSTADANGTVGQPANHARGQRQRQREHTGLRTTPGHEGRRSLIERLHARPGADHDDEDRRCERCAEVVRSAAACVMNRTEPGRFCLRCRHARRAEHGG